MDIWTAYESVQRANEEKKMLEENMVDTELAPTSVDIDMEEDVLEIIEQMKKVEIEPIRSKNEIPLEELPIEPLPKEVNPVEDLIKVCKVTSHCGNFTIASACFDYKAITPGSLLLDENRNPVTRVLDVIGQVNSPQIVLREDVPVGTTLYTINTQSSWVSPDELERMYVGCDGSNKFDEPVAFGEGDFSDDEKELEFKSKKK